MAKFELVDGPFGGMDERASHEAFESFMGGPDRAFAIMRAYESASMSHRSDGPYKSRVSLGELFRRVAKNRGFSDAEADAYLLLNGGA